MHSSTPHSYKQLKLALQWKTKDTVREAKATENSFIPNWMTHWTAELSGEKGKGAGQAGKRYSRGQGDSPGRERHC